MSEDLDPLTRTHVLHMKVLYREPDADHRTAPINTKPHGPAVASLIDCMEKLRTYPPQRNKGLKQRLEKLLGQFPRFPGHFLYIYNFSEGRITYARGFQDLLGYRDEEVDVHLIFGALHPEDAPIVANLNQRAIEAMAKVRDPKNLMDLSLSVDHRMQKANGEYIKILRQTAVFEVDKCSGKVHSTFSLCKDISTIKPNGSIGWQISGFDLIEFEAPEDTTQRVQYRPSPREMDVLRKLAEGMSSKVIAQELDISLHTVNTHRRNMLSRTGLSNTTELVRRIGGLGWL